MDTNRPDPGANAAPHTPAFIRVGRPWLDAHDDRTGFQLRLDRRLTSLARTAALLVDVGLQPNTLRAYTGAWAQWEAWAEEYDVEALPAVPDVFALYLTEAAFALSTDAEPVLDEAGKPRRGRLGHSALLQHVKAVDRVHDAAGHPKPGDTTVVADVVSASRRTFGKGSPRCDPLDRAGLEIAVGAMEQPRDRDLLLLVLCHLNLSASALRDLDKGHLSWHVSACHDVTHTGLCSEGGVERDLVIATDAGVKRHTLVDMPVLLGLGDDTSSVGQPLFAYQTPKTPPGTLGRYSRQGLTARARKVAQDCGLHVPRTGLPRPGSDELVRARAYLADPAADLRAARDRSLLTAWWTTGLRPGAGPDLLWKNCDLVPGPPTTEADTTAVVIHLNREKQDREGKGRILDLPTAGHASGPAETYSAWRTAAAAALGGDPALVEPDAPIWFRIARDGTPWRDPHGRLAPLSAAAVTKLLQGRLAAAGVDGGHFTGGSFRAGLVTELHHDGLQDEQVCERSGHRSKTSMHHYNRPHFQRK